MAAANMYYDKRAASSASATSAAAGYAASNILLEELGRPWRSTSTGANDVDIVFPSALGVHSLFVHDVNFSSCTVKKSADGVDFSPTVGTLTTYADRFGRRRGRITVNDATVKALRLQISGTPSDGLAYWRIGAAYPFGSVHAIPADLNFPVVEEIESPGVENPLPNGLVPSATTGMDIATIETTWNRESTESLATLVAKARAGTVLFDAGTGDYPEQMWPVYLPPKRKDREVFDRFRFSRPVLSFRERV